MDSNEGVAVSSQGAAIDKKRGIYLLHIKYFILKKFTMTLIIEGLEFVNTYVRE